MRVKEFIDLYVSSCQNVLIIADKKIVYAGLALTDKMEKLIEEMGGVDYLNLWVGRVGTDEMRPDYLVIVAEF